MRNFDLNCAPFEREILSAATLCSFALKAEFARDKNGAFELPHSGQESGASHPDRTHW